MLELGLRRVAHGSVIAITLTACGGDSSSNSSGSSTTGTATNPTTAAPTTSTTGTGTGGTTGGSGSSSSGTAPGSSSGGDFCPLDSHRCVPDPPAGWTGPLSLASLGNDGMTPTCDAAFPDMGSAGFPGLQADDAACSCSCSDPTGTQCSPSVELHFYGNDATCSSTPVSTTVFAAGCQSFPGPFAGNGHYVADPVLAQGGSCDPQQHMQDLADPVLDPTVTTCGGAQLGSGCANGSVCAPLAAGAGPLCVTQDGEQDCPHGYPHRQVLYTDVEDTRACTDCSCSEPSGLCQDAFLSLYSGTSCPLPVAGFIFATGECDPSGGNQTLAATLNTGTPSAFCTASGGDSQGEVTAINPFTLCCAD